MLGMLSSPGTSRGDTAFLLCNPYGQEAVRSKPMYRAFADRLLREGVHALRFDYHGTGDSPGDEEPQTLAEWVRDTLCACATLRQATRARRLHLFGIGLGATIAARAALAIDPAPERLILWEPIFDGTAYVQALLDAHREELAFAFGEDWATLKVALGEAEPAVPGCVLGFSIGPELARELGELRGLPLDALAARGCKVECALREPQSRPAHACIAWHVVEEPVNWMSNEAMSTAIAPREIQAALLGALAAT